MSAGPISTILPRYITAIVWLMCATAARSCAMKRYDTPSCACRSRRRFRIWARTDTSSTMTLGDSESARAIAMRWRWPPENSCGKSSAARSGRPTRSSNRSRRLRTSADASDSLVTSGSTMIEPTRMRGLSDAYGSWNTACTERRYARRLPPSSAWRSWPSKRMTPPVGRSSSSTILAVVVLPQPDSPTTPRVRPGSIENEMSSTARTTATSREIRPRLTGKCLTRFLASRTGPAMVASASPRDRRRRQPAAARLRVRDAKLGRSFGAAAVHHFGTARVKRAARGRRRRIRRLPIDGGQPLAAVAEPRNRFQERARVGMRRRVVDLLDRPGLDQAARVHHRDLVAHLGDDAEVVRDEDQGQVVRALQIAQQIQVLGLDGDIEACRRLVGDEDPRLARDGDRAHDALPHAARELVGVLAHAGLRRRDAHRLQELGRLLPRAAAGRPLVDADRLGDLVAHREQRVQRHHRVLQDHRDPLAADAPHLVLGLLQEIGALEEHLARDDASRRRQHAQEGQRQGSLARARLAHDAERLALIERQGDVVHGARDARATRAHVVRGQAPYVEERTGHNWRSCGSNFTRSQSPRRFADRTISMMHEPGSTVSHQ